MNTISLDEYYLLIPFFKKTEKLNWPNRARTLRVNSPWGEAEWAIFGFHVTSEKTKIRNFEFLTSSGKSHF